MKVLVFGSLNVDYVYSVAHIVREGETLLSSGMELFPGGKGLNQAAALSKAGAAVHLAGSIGEDGQVLLDNCKQFGVNTDFVKTLPGRSGHTIIQVDEQGRNCILLFGGTNQRQTQEHIAEVLRHFGEGDYLLLQNEINLMGCLIDRAFDKGMRIVLNPSPFDERLRECDLKKVWLFFLNEIEGEQLTSKSDPDEIIKALREMFPESRFVLTLGSRGAYYAEGTQKLFQPAFPVKAVDTTAAGDTFTGYFIAALLRDQTVEEALQMAAKASAITVSRPGALPSIPTMDEVAQYDF